MFCLCPVKKLSQPEHTKRISFYILAGSRCGSQITWNLAPPSSSTNLVQMCDPTKPAPPVTSTLVAICHEDATAIGISAMRRWRLAAAVGLVVLTLQAEAACDGGRAAPVGELQLHALSMRWLAPVTS